ncbi:hypothetical protein CFC21_082551, partial [Triticum aestivum]
MDAYLNGLMNDNANPDNLFEYEYYLFAGEGSDVDDMEHDKLEDSMVPPRRVAQRTPCRRASSCRRSLRKAAASGSCCHPGRAC